MPGQASNIQGTIHVDRYLTNFSVKFTQDARNFVAQRAASIVPVLKQTDKYVVYDRGYFWRDEAQARPLTKKPVEIGYKTDEGTYSATEYALEHLIDDRQRANVDEPIRLDENASELLTMKHMIKQDRVWATQFFQAGQWSTDILGADSSPGVDEFLQFNDATSSPIRVFKTYKNIMHERTGFMPNTVVLGADVALELLEHPDILDRIKYTQTGVVDEDLLAALIGIPNVVVARSVYNAAAEGQTNDFTYITNKKAMWMGYIDPTPSLDSPTAIVNFAWTGLIPGQTNALGGVIERGRDERAHSDWFQGRMAWDLRKVADDLGIFFDNVVA